MVMIRDIGCYNESCIMVYELRSNFGVSVLWWGFRSKELVPNGNQWSVTYGNGNDLVCSGLMVGIQERDGHALSIMVRHALLSRGVEFIAFIICICIEWLCWCWTLIISMAMYAIEWCWIIVVVCLGYPYILLHYYILWAYSHTFVVCVLLCSF